jgi:hypothetical protein
MTTVMKTAAVTPAKGTAVNRNSGSNNSNRNNSGKQK